MRPSEGNTLGEVKKGIDREAEYSILKGTVTKEPETYCGLNISLRGNYIFNLSHIMSYIFNSQRKNSYTTQFLFLVD